MNTNLRPRRKYDRTVPLEPPDSGSRRYFARIEEGQRARAEDAGARLRALLEEAHAHLRERERLLEEVQGVILRDGWREDVRRLYGESLLLEASTGNHVVNPHGSLDVLASASRSVFGSGGVARGGDRMAPAGRGWAILRLRLGHVLDRVARPTPILQRGIGRREGASRRRILHLGKAVA